MDMERTVLWYVLKCELLIMRFFLKGYIITVLFNIANPLLQ